MLFNNYLISLLGIGGVVGTIAGVGIVYSNQRSNKDIPKDSENATSNIETKGDSLIKDTENTENNEERIDEEDTSAQEEGEEVPSVQQPPSTIPPSENPPPTLPSPTPDVPEASLEPADTETR